MSGRDRTRGQESARKQTDRQVLSGPQLHAAPSIDGQIMAKKRAAWARAGPRGSLRPAAGRSPDGGVGRVGTTGGGLPEEQDGPGASEYAGGLFMAFTR